MFYNPPNDSTITWDTSKKDPAPAPDPKEKNPNMSEEEMKQIYKVNIIKFYERHEEDMFTGETEITYEGNYLRENNPPLIQIVDEELNNGSYRVVDHYTIEDKITTEYPQDTPYDDVKATNMPINQGNIPTTVKLNIDDTKPPMELTLYVKLVANDSEPLTKIEREVVIQESEISKAFSQKTLDILQSYKAEYRGYDPATHSYT